MGGEGGGGGLGTERSESQRALLELQRELEAARVDATERNVELQKKVVELLASRKKREAAAGGGGAPKGGDADEKGLPEGAAKASAQESEKLYAEALANVVETRAKQGQERQARDAMMHDLQLRLDTKVAEADAIAKGFGDFRLEVLETAENSRTGRKIPKSVISRFESEDRAKSGAVEGVRLKNIDLRMRLRRLEASLRRKEQLAEGLHLIDFEQLKIENQTLNEKIEDRNEELRKLRRKNTHTVQILTHIKEKLTFALRETGTREQELAGLEAVLASERDRLGRAKREREALRAENLALRQRQGFASSELLVRDYEQRSAQLESMRRRVAESRREFQLLEATIGDCNTALSAANASAAGPPAPARPF